MFIIQDYLNKNRCFTIDDITPFINSRLRELSIGLNYEGIREILKSLLEKKMIFERSKLTKSQILNNENRERIYTYICENPGVYFYQIAKTLNLSNYILGWHIKMLIKFNFIRSKEIDKHEVFFDINLEEEHDELYYFISKEKSQIIISYLIKNPQGITKTRISRELKIHPKTTSKYIKSLEVLNLLLKKKETKKTLYFLNEPLYSQVSKN